MSVSGQVSIVSSIGTQLVFTVTGTNTLGYAKQFEKILLNAGTVTENVLHSDGTVTSGTESNGGTYALTFNEVTVPGAYTLPGTDPHAITFVDQNGSSTITGSGVNDYVMFTGINPFATYDDVGGNNTIIFTSGDNLYDGSAAGATGKDVIVAGSGQDTILTGTGSDTVYSGTGRANITLNDTSSGAFNGTFNDFVYLSDGVNTVHASGAADAIVASAADQTIYGASVAGAATIVTILPGDTTAAVGGDSVYGMGGNIAVFDSVGGNTFFGGTSGQAYFVSGTDVADTVNSNGGPVYMFGSAGDSITFAGTIADGTISGFAAGLGNETLNGAGWTGGGGVLELFANNTTDATAAAGINDSLQGGGGLTAFVSGEGNETLSGGTGGNLFIINHTADGSDSNTGTILVNDFAQNNNWAVGFAGYSQSEIATAEANAVVGGPSDPSYTIKLSDGTTVQFVGVNSLTGHTF